MRFLSGILLFLVVSGIGLVLLSISLSSISKKIQWISEAKTASGKIIDIVVKNSENLSSTSNRGEVITGKFPVVEFQSEDGKTYKATQEVSTLLLRYEIGDIVTVQYHLGEESNADVKNYFAQFFMSIFLLFFGLIFFVTGCFAGWIKISKASLF